MLKRILVCLLALVLMVVCMTSGFAAATEDTAPLGGDAAYSVVSAVVNREYDFAADFHDSYPYDEDFETVGIFELDDYNGDVTLTLKNNSTGEEFVYEKNADTEWSVKASVDHLLYETTQFDAAVRIYNLGGEYGIENVDVPVTITVVSSQYSADVHKYPSYDGSWTAMYEGEDFTVEYDPSSSDGKATIHLLKSPWLFSLRIYNVETKEAEYHDTDDSEFVFPTEAEVTDFDPSKRSFWFFLPSKLIMEDGYEFEFTMSVQGFLKEKQTDGSDDQSGGKASDDSATKDSAPASPDSKNTNSGNKKAVQTGDSPTAFILAGAFLIAAAVFAFFGRKRRTTR